MFDFAAKCVSGGRWKLWGRTSIGYIHGLRVLELGHGPGHLLLELKRAGLQPTGIDLSPSMGTLAMSRLRHAGVDLPVVRCRAQILPFRANSFDAAVATFPTNDILQLTTLREVARVIHQGGVFAMVVGAQREGSRPNTHFVEWLKVFTGQDGNGRNVEPSVFSLAGFRPRIEYQFVEESPVFLIVAEKHQREDGRANMPPMVDITPDVTILSKDQFRTALKGKATDADEDILVYRWLREQAIVSDWKPIGENGSLSLELQNLPPLEVGQHSLCLEVTDRYETVVDVITLTVKNSPPVIVMTEEGTYEMGRPVIVSARIYDYDGDLLDYWWLEERTVLENGSIQAVKQGEAVTLSIMLTSLSIGVHVLRLWTSDRTNPPVSSFAKFTVEEPRSSGACYFSE